MKLTDVDLAMSRMPLDSGTAVMCPVPIMVGDVNQRLVKRTEIRMRGVVLQRRDVNGNPITRDAAGQYLVAVSSSGGTNVVVAFDSELIVLEGQHGVHARAGDSLG